MTPEEQLKQACLKRFGCREDLFVFVNKSGQAKYTRKDGSTRAIPYGLTTRYSSDLIVGRRLLILPEMVGCHILRFGVVELKAPGASTEEERLRGQINFYERIIGKGGFGGIATTPDEMEGIICQPLNLTI